MVKEDPVSVDVKEESKKQRKDSVKKRKKKDKHKKKKAKRSKLSSSSSLSATITPKGGNSDSLQKQVGDEKEEDANPPLVSSWGQAFAAASSVQPLSLGDDFTPIGEASHATSDTATGFRGNISLISQIAKEATSQQAEQKTVKQPEAMPPAKKKKSKKKKSKKDPSVHKTAESTTPAQHDNTTPATLRSDFPYQTDPDDHCESPSVAYEDILPLLKYLANNKKGSDLAIYDPYFCDGYVVSNLSKLGFSNVYHKKEDCYKTWSTTNTDQPYPKCDVFLTNPPYSGDHVEKLMFHLTADNSPIQQERKAWFLLMPNYVHKKEYYKSALNNGHCQPFYLVPKKRYVYLPPKNFREKKNSDVHKKSSPFVSMWYIWGGTKEKTDRLIQAYKKWERTLQGESKLELARTKSALRDLRRKKR